MSRDTWQTMAYALFAIVLFLFCVLAFRSCEPKPPEPTARPTLTATPPPTWTATLAPPTPTATQPPTLTAAPTWTLTATQVPPTSAPTLAPLPTWTLTATVALPARHMNTSREYRDNGR